MDNEQILKRLAWLEDERRKDKAQISDLENKLAILSNNMVNQPKQINQLTNELNQLPILQTRIEKFEGALAQAKVDFAKLIDLSEKRREEYNREAEKSRRNDFEVINKSLNELRKTEDPMPEVRKAIQTRVDEDAKLMRLIDELRATILQSQRSEDETKRGQRMFDDIQRQDSKRITDLQTEFAALRKRFEEYRGRLEISIDTIRKIELRSNEIYAAEGERRQAQNAFIEKQNLMVVEQERVWEEWAQHFEEINRQSEAIDAQLEAMDVTTKELRHAQTSFEDVSQRFERRVNEITEMQRLVEERFRQEWVMYKAEDQKKWTNMMLTQEDLHRENLRQADKNNDRLVVLEEQFDEVKDMLKQYTADNFKNVQSLAATIEHWVDSTQKVIDSYNK